MPGMDERAQDLRAGAPAAAALSWDDWDNAPAVAATTAAAAPVLHLDGFDGPIDLLLDLAERQRIDLGRLSLLTLVEQFLAAFDQLRDRVALERRADWLVMATRLVLLRSRLLFPENPGAAQDAEQDAAIALRRLDDLVDMRPVMAWLNGRPMLGQTVFARGRPEHMGVQLGMAPDVDVIAFLWASLALFEDDEPAPDTTARYRPSWSDLHSVTEARDRILRILASSGEGRDGAPLALGHCLPETVLHTDEKGMPIQRKLVRMSAWATTFSASLELAKQGDVTLLQGEAFADIHVGRIGGHPEGAGAVNVSGDETALFDRLVDAAATQMAGSDRVAEPAADPPYVGSPRKGRSIP